MIRVTKINGESVFVNALLVELVEATPDTIVTLTTGHKIMVRDSVADIVARTKEYTQAVGLQPPRPAPERHEA